MNKIQEDCYKKIKEKLADREYRIGLDLGVGSIGYAVVSLKGDMPEDVILAGSRIFKSSIGAVERRLSRLQRNSHRHHRERMRYLWKLLAEKNLALPLPENLSKKENPIDFDTSRKRFPIEVLRNDPYILRYKALNEKLSLFQLGYALYHIANHRGTASVRSFLEDDEAKVKENKETAKLAKNTKKIMDEMKYRTFGEYLYKERIEKSKQNERVKVTNRKTAKNENKEFAVTRDIIEKEVEIILGTQKRYNTAVLTDDYIERIKKAIFYETEKLIPEPEHCPYFKDDKRLPRFHKLNEYRRIYEALNNTRYSIPEIEEKTGKILSYKEKQPLSKEEKEKLFNFLLKNKDLTEAKARELLKLSDMTKVQLQGRDKKNQKIKGYALITLESLPFWSKLPEQQQDEFLYDWNKLPDEKLKDRLRNYYKLTDNEINETFKFKNIVPSSNYAPVGKKAMEILLEYIKNDLSYIEALDKAVDENKFKVEKHEINDLLPYYGKILQESTQMPTGKAFSKQFAAKNYKKPDINKNEQEFGRVANPVVHQTLNELRKLVNEIITLFGKKPLGISLETSRELKKSQEDRERIAKQQDSNEKNRKRIWETYIEPHLPQIKRREQSQYIFKFKLLEYQNSICPYCIKKITPNDIIYSRADKEHIFPLKESEDDGENNLVIAHSKCNDKKGKKAPFEAFGHEPIWNDILSNAEKNLPLKVWRFYQGSFEKFLEKKPMQKRFETDNSYISKISARYLACLFDKLSKIFCVKSYLTAQLRIAWELNEIMIPLAKNIISDSEKDSFNEGGLQKKIRIDNRHHALDAVAIAYASRGYHNFLNRASALNRVSAKDYKINYDEKNWLSKILLPPGNKNLEDFKSGIRDVMVNANISIKHDHNNKGQFVKSTAYKLYYSEIGKYIITTLKSVSEIPFKQKEKPQDTLRLALCKFEDRLSDIKDRKLRKKLEDNIDIYKRIQNESTLSKAKQKLEEFDQKAKKEGKKGYEKITDILIYKKACSIIGGKYIHVENKIENKFFALKEPTEIETGFGYDTADNLSLDLYHNNNGKLCGEVIRKIDFNRNRVPNYKKEGYILLERIYQGDTLEVDISDDKISLKNKVGFAPDKRTFVKVLTFTELDGYFKNKRDQIQIFFCNLLKSTLKHDDSFCVSSMQKYNVRKVILTSLGIIKYRSKILKNKEI